MEYYSVIRKNKTVPFVSNMDGTREDYNTKRSKSDKDKYHKISFVRGI